MIERLEDAAFAALGILDDGLLWLWRQAVRVQGWHRTNWVECGVCGQEWWLFAGFPARACSTVPGVRDGCWLCRRWLWRVLAARSGRIGGYR